MTEKTMKGIMFVERGKAVMIDEPMPQCTADTVLLRTLYSGLSNGTERSFLMGGPYGGQQWPTRIAYQLVSEVIECGENISRFANGDIVYTGTYPGHVEYHLAHETDLIIRLPAAFDLEAGGLLGLACVAYHDARRARVHPEDNVLVIGDGLIGQFASQVARLHGATVTMAGHHDDRLELARKLGADRVVNTKHSDGQAQLREHAPYTVIFECSGATVLDLIIGLPGKPGLVARRSQARLVLVAGRFDVRYNFNMAGMAELDIIHTQHFDQSDLEQVIRLVVRGDIRLRPLLRDVVPFEDAIGIFDSLRDDRSKLLGTVFAMPAAIGS